MICILPRAGLGNQLFPLLHAAVFARLNQLPLKVSGYRQWKIGPWLRRENNKRQYKGFFVFEKKGTGAWADRWRLRRLASNGQVVKEPEIALRADSRNCSYLFEAMPHWNDYFAALKEHRALVKSCLYDLLEPTLITGLSKAEAPCIAVHIRMGDFRKLGAGEDFSKAGAVRTPENWFVEVINQIRALHGSALPVTVFTDGYVEELPAVMALEGVALAAKRPDVVDMLLLSKSKVLVTSAGSTFSYWAAFLADAPVIMHPDHIHEPLRPESVNREWYEGPINVGSALLTRNIRGIAWDGVRNNINGN